MLPVDTHKTYCTRGISSLMALPRIVSVKDISLAAIWSSMSTSVQSYLSEMTTDSVSHLVFGALSVVTSSEADWE